MTETDKDDTFMAATWYRTWYHRDVTNHILTVEGLGNEGWGPWHELGHMHQQSAWTWDTLGEVTVNIYALAAERAMGVSPSRLVRDGVWYAVADFLALPDGQRKVKDLEIAVSNDNQNWESLGDHVLEDDTTPQDIDLAESRSLRYFKLTMKSAHDGQQFAAMAEVTVH